MISDVMHEGRQTLLPLIVLVEDGIEHYSKDPFDILGEDEVNEANAILSELKATNSKMDILRAWFDAPPNIVEGITFKIWKDWVMIILILLIID